MKLKYQLLLLALLSLIFPVTGWFALKSVDKEFRLNIEQASKNTLISLKASVEQMLQNNPELEFYGLIPVEVDDFILDGDNNEWNSVTSYYYKNQSHELTAQIGLNKNKLMILINTNDSTKNINSIDSSSNDHLIIALANDRGLYKLKFQRQAEGIISKQNDNDNEPGYQAYWHEKSNGYMLEIIFDDENFHHLGFASVNQLPQSKYITGTLDTEQTIKLLPIISTDTSFRATIQNITPNNNHFAIKDKLNRIMYQSNKLPNNSTVSAWQWIITPIYQWLFGIDNTNDSKWFYRQSDGMAGIKHSITHQDIIYELKSMMPQGQQNMIQTLLKASVLMIVVVLLLMIAYLGYALILAWRIKNLNKAMQTVLDDSGRLHTIMPSHKSVDEIGQLSRGIESMLVEMREYTQYLKDLGSRLSHEMKTPLAIVQSSLDNLEMKQSPEFLQRAQDGTKRLRFILNQLSGLTQLKYTLEQTPKHSFDLNALIQQLGQSYQSYINNLKLTISQTPIYINGSPELIAQLVDKLMDNAKDYVLPDGYIELSLSIHKDKTRITLFNTDSRLPEKKGLNIFDSLVSIRSKKANNSIHLGLGLYLVQLICRYHNAKIIANNTCDPKGVVFIIEFINPTT